MLVSFKQPTSSLHSITRSSHDMADLWKHVAYRDSNLPKTSRFFVASPAALLCMVPGQLLFPWKAGSRLVSPRPSRESDTSVSTWLLYFTLGSTITLDTLPSVKIRRGCNVNNIMFAMKERSQRSEIYTIVILSLDSNTFVSTRPLYFTLGSAITLDIEYKLPYNNWVCFTADLCVFL